MKKIFSAKFIMGFIATSILFVSTTMVVRSIWIPVACIDYCSTRYGGSDILFSACMEGCLFGANN